MAASRFRDGNIKYEYAVCSSSKKGGSSENQKQTYWWECVKGPKSQVKELIVIKLYKFDQKLNKVALDDNTNYKINIHDFKLMEINDWQINEWEKTNLLCRELKRIQANTLTSRRWSITLLQVVHSHFFPKRQYGKDGGGVAGGSGQLYSVTPNTLCQVGDGSQYQYYKAG